MPVVSNLLAASMMSPGQLILIAVILFSITAMTMASRRRRELSESPRTVARRQIARLKEKNKVNTDVTDLMMQLQQVAREVSAQLDNKFVRLERVIADADRRIAALGVAKPVRGDQVALDVTIGDGPTDVETGDAPRFSKSPHHDRILALNDEGQSPVEIASVLGRSIEEIELVIAIDGRRRATADLRTA